MAPPARARDGLGHEPNHGLKHESEAMSLRDFQSNLARLVALPGFRQSVQAQGERALGGHLDPRERARLLAVAADPGLVVTSTLVASFRLGKLLQWLPLTRVLLGNRALVREAQQFWRRWPPTSFYAAEEVLAFCDHLQRRRRRPVPGLGDIVALERALLELGRPRPDGETAPAQVVRFRYDAAAMLDALTAGRRPRHLGARARACGVRVEGQEDGTVRWTALVSGARSPRPTLRRTRRSPLGPGRRPHGSDRPVRGVVDSPPRKRATPAVQARSDRR